MVELNAGTIVWNSINRPHKYVTISSLGKGHEKRKEKKIAAE